MTYNGPILKYSDIVWDNCTSKEKQDLEGIQLAAARVLTGGKKGTEHILLYSATPWEPLEARRENHKITMMYKIVIGQVPATLTQLLSLTGAARHQHNVRSREDLTL